MTTAEATPLPPDYFRRLAAVEDVHWWYRSMRELTRALLGNRFSASRRLLDAGCGTGGFLRWALDEDTFERVAAVDVSREATELARGRVPEAEIRVAPLSELPFPDASFDLVACNDVLQHLHEADVEPALSELARVLDAGGTLILRTNGARRARRERDDWRIYDRRTLAATLARAGFRCERLTYASIAGSALAVLRGRRPGAPTAVGDGIPIEPSRAASAVAAALGRLEAQLLARPGSSIPWGHTLFAVAAPAP